MRTGRRCRARLRRAGVVIAAVLVGALGACGKADGSGAGLPTPATSSTSVPSPAPSATSPTPSTSSPTSTAAADLLVPSAVLEKALVTEVLGKSYSVDQTDSGDYPTTGGLNISSLGEYVSGDRGCLGLFNAHTPSPEAFAYVAMSNKTAWFEEVAESYPTVAEARKVMAENIAQAKTCRTFKMRSTEGEVVTYKHTVTAAKNTGVDADLFLHHINGRTQAYTYEFHLFEGRVGGELVNIIWASSSLRADPSSAAFTQFQKVINAYRKDHPRQGGGGSSGVSPVTADRASGTPLPSHDTPINRSVRGPGH